MTTAKRRNKILKYIEANPNDSVRNISAALGIPKSSVQRAVTWFRKHGHIAQREDHTPNVLLFDIETTPMLSWHWRTYKENIAPVQVMKYQTLLCWAAKWLNAEHVMFDHTRKDGDDQRCCEALWKLCDMADVLVAHNGNAFDITFMNARWAYYNIAPPSPTKVIDTCKTARAVFRGPGSSLDGLVRYFDLGGKMQHQGFQLWLDCMDGDKRAWNTMEKYNIQDTLMLQALYLKIRPWDKRHPNLALLYPDADARCVKCGSTYLVEMDKFAHTSVSQFEAWRCEDCGSIMRSGKRFDPKEVLRNVV